ncbi:hypothetical protein MUO71_04365 [Candidatus Bathyarchaeota archaeon]|nr:hypothetical protein [Candidatus Bathyarchaeota archaeon]
MDEVINIIKKNAEERVLLGNDGNQDFAMYIDHQVMKKGSVIDVITDKITFKQPTILVFVDDEPEKNFGHRCHFLLYNAENGEFIDKVPAKFPHFMHKKIETVELFRSSETIERYKRKKKLRIKLEPAKLSAYRKLAPFPLKFNIRGRRFAILFSGASNGRHVNDIEFMYRTLVDVYGYDTNDIYVLNYDGTINYNQLGWETSPASGFGADGTPWRLTVNGRGDRAGFQAVISDISSRIRSWDCLLIHTNNHGWYDNNGGYLSAYGGTYHANDFANDLAQLPNFKTLLVVMEQCASGSFAQPIMNNSPASHTVFQAAVPGDESSAGGWPFDPWAEMWISAMAGVRGDGSALPVSPDDDLDTLISAWEAYDYSIAIDNPVMSESSVNLSQKVFISRCITTIKILKEWKEVKEWKEPKDLKEVKERKEPKEYLEPKEVFEPKQIKEQKEFMEPKRVSEPKSTYEGPDIPILSERIQIAYDEITERVDRLEETVKKLKPFITDEKRPDVKPINKRKG